MSVLGRLTLVVGLSLLAWGCGRKGPLIYPDMLVPAAPASVSAQQSGLVVKLQFVVPDKDLGGRSVQGVAGVKISRKAAEGEEKNICRACMTDYALFRTIYLDHLPSNTQRFGNRLIFLDDEVASGRRYFYSIIPFTANGFDGAQSLPADVFMSVPLPAPVLKVESYPTELRVQMSAQPVAVGTQAGFNLYRSPAGSPRPYLPLNREPLKGYEYIDSGMERGVKYRYSARQVIMSASGIMVESSESEEAEGMLKDDE